MDNLEKLIPVEAIQERDIDLLILEELIVNIQFRKWIIELLELEKEKQFIGAWHSLTQVGLGESDLALIYESETEKHLLLIENKINAELQYEQANRYRLRGLNYQEKGICTKFHTIIIAPEKYLLKTDEFDFQITYEMLSKWFDENTGKRFEYKKQIFQIAIEKQRRGYSSIPDEGATNFWWSYYEYAIENHKHLNMRKPPEKIPKRSSFVFFNPENIGIEDVGSFVHKLGGNIDFQLDGMAKEIDKMKEVMESRLSKGMMIKKAGKSLSFRFKTKEIDNRGSFDNQIEKIEEAFVFLNILYNWTENNIEKIKSVANIKS
jgi:hypothetical protein